MKFLDLGTSFLGRFARDEHGEVTIAWVVLTASLMSLGIMVTTIMGGGTEALADKTGETLAEAEIPVY